MIADIPATGDPTVLPELNKINHVAYIIGYTDGTVRPMNSITRAEVTTIFFRLLTDESRAVYWSQSNPYTDVTDTSWYNNAVSTMTNAGIVGGYPDGSFRPDQPITRAEAIALTNRVLERAVEEEHMLPDMITWPDNTPDAWYYEAVQEATNSHIYTRIDKCVPDQNFNFEHWLEILQIPDWESLEKTWSAAYSK